jgi:RHS repeat-associated protein
LLKRKARRDELAGLTTAAGFSRSTAPTSAGALVIEREAAKGREKTTTLGQITTERTYTSFGEPETMTVKHGATEIYFEKLTYNKVGWITDLERRQSGGSTTQHFEYDLRGRLEEVWTGGVLESSYSYDANSNRLSYDGPLGNATGSYDARDRMSSYGPATFTYRESGELLSKTEASQTTTYEYDVFGNLRQVDLPSGIAIEYLTDGAQRRIGKKINGVLVKQWLYQDHLEPIAELDGAGNVVTRCIYGTRAHVPDYLIKGGTTYRVVSDHLGSPRLIVNEATGTVAQELRYDEFGRVLLDTNPGFQPFGFAGGIYDGQTGLVRFGARDYDPVVGRWTAMDPGGLVAARYNFYLYVSGNPQSFIDPDGKRGFSILLGVGVNTTVLAGGELSAGGYLNVASGDHGVFGSAGATAGVSLGADAFVGVVYGSEDNVRGDTTNVNIGLGPAAFSFFFDPATEKCLGFTVGGGPSAPPINASVSKAATEIFSIPRFIEDLAERVNEAFGLK